MLHLELWHLVAAAVAAYGIGLSKTGIAGVGIVAVALFSVAMPGRTSVGIVLPLLVCGDCFAVVFYRRHAVWSHLIRLFPWAALGIVLGTVAMGKIDDHQVQALIGVLLIALTALQAAQQTYELRLRAPAGDSNDAPIPGFLARGGAASAILGILAGFATMVGNAAGPLMILYLLAARLPKMEFVGTGAWYFFCLNLFKLPFSARLGLMNYGTIVADLQLAIFVVLGALTGKPLLEHLNQSLFERISMFFTAAAGIWLIYHSGLIRTHPIHTSTPAVPHRASLILRDLRIKDPIDLPALRNG